MKVVIDPDRCTGHGRCYVLAPGVFADDDAGYSQALHDGQVARSEEAAAERAAVACPEHAITIEP